MRDFCVSLGDRRVSRLAAAVGLALSLGVGGQAMAQLQWRTGASPRPAPMTSEQVRASLDGFGAGLERDGAGARRFIAHFAAPVTPDVRRSLEKSGLHLLASLGANAYFASITPGAMDLDALTRDGHIAAIEPILPRYKLHPDLLAGVVQPWAVIKEAGADDAALAAELDGEAEKLGPVTAVYVQFHKDVDPAGEGAPLVIAAGGEIISVLPTVNAVVAHIPAARVHDLAALDAVQNIEPPLPKFSELNAENRVRTGADTIQAPPYGLTGTGVDVLIYDGGTVRATHQDLAPRVIIGDTDTVSDHATHVMGTVGGTGAASAGAEMGMAPGVSSLISYGFEVPGGTLMPGFLYTEPGDFIADYTQAITTHGADISNNSIGTNTAPNGYDCNWEGDYGLMSELIDQMVRGTITGSPFRVVWANGNERGGSARCGSTYRTTAPPACAKNHITVGALNSNDDLPASFTSWGPADDGRMKPDIAAPGCEVGGDGGVRSASSSSDTAYSVKCGTSMASPTVCGLGAILLSDFRTLYPSRPDFRNSTLKTLLAHTAVDLDNPGPDNKYGYGSVRIVPAVELLRSGNFSENEVGQGGTVGVVVVVQPGDPELKVTLAWDDYQGTGNMIPQLVNDLDLVVRSPSNVRAYPWTLGGTANPGAPAVRTQENHIDNIEQVFVANPEPGAWLVEIRGTAVPQGPQSFSIAATPFLVNCSDRGIASLDKAVYRCSGAVSLRVSDCGLNTSDAVVDTVTVTVASESEPGGESVLLTETAAQSAEFRASINIDTTDSVGVLRVANGDTITMTYIDADDGMGGMGVTTTTTAEVDCLGPVITSVVATGVQPRAATVTFTTNEPATGAASFGTSCGSLSGNASSSTRTTTHAIALSGLLPNTTYSFIVRATDDAGNQSVNDAGGACYSFTTPAIPDFFTELWSTGETNDLDNRSNTFNPAPIFDGYIACAEGISVLPVDPTAHTAILFPGTQDDQFFQINLTGGQTVKLYGQSYSSVFVGSNGYLTFTVGDTDSTESTTDHFETPRVSMFFDNLNPGQGGSVRWAQLADSLVVSFVNVPEDNVVNTNTFQAQLFFDGTIRLSWLGLGAADGMAGLSRGAGIPPDYIESDLTSYGPCGDRPPTAASGVYNAAVATGVDINLIALDDGTPGPLTYKIMSLPANGALVDPGAGVITTVPHTLVGGGSMVRYAPRGLYQGIDSFLFRANDGGMPPTGGDSSNATISLTIGGAQPVRQFLVDDSNPGWTTEDQWAFGQPQGLGSRNRDPLAGFTGQNVYGYNLAGDYTNSMPERHLTSTAINLSGITGTTLSFQRWLGIESSTFDRASVRVSTDATNWTTIWSHSGGSQNPSSWTQVTYDISAVADNSPTVYLRWTMGTTDTSVIYVGWNIDDVVISGLIPLSACDGDVNFDGSVNLADLAVIIKGWGSAGATVREGDADFDGNVGLSDLAVVVNNWESACP